MLAGISKRQKIKCIRYETTNLGLTVVLSIRLNISEKMLSATSGVVSLRSIVRYLYEILHVFSLTCNIYTNIEEYLLWIVRFAGICRYQCMIGPWIYVRIQFQSYIYYFYFFHVQLKDTIKVFFTLQSAVLTFFFRCYCFKSL